MPDEIIYFDSTGKEIGREPASTSRRFSMRAAANQNKIDIFKRKHPEVASARCDGFEFQFDGAGRAQAKFVSGYMGRPG